MRLLQPISLLALFTGLLPATPLSLIPGSILVQQLAFPPAGTIAQYSKSGAAAGTLGVTGTFDIPESMTVLNGQVYVSDGSGRVNTIDLATGKVISYFNTLSYGLNSLGNYRGNLLALDVAFPSTVGVYSTDGFLLQSITLASVPTGANWNGITSDGTTLYVADYASGRIYQYSSSGAALGFLDTALGRGLTGVSYDSANGSLWVADAQTNQVYDFSTAGVLLSHFAVGLKPNAGIAVVPEATPEPNFTGPLGGTLMALALYLRVKREGLFRRDSAKPLGSISH